MIDELKPYPKMKDSGVEWLGEVPERWSILRIGQLGGLFKGNGGNKTDEVASGIPCVRYGDLYTRHEFFIRNTKAYLTPERSADYTQIRFGDVLFAASGETVEDIGRSAVNLIKSEARCGGDVLVLRPTVEVNPNFLAYASDCAPARHQKARMGRGFTVVHIYASQLKHLAIAIPPLPEQGAIVRFLDYADRRIRRYIRAKQKLMKLLEEQKQAIIHRAITRGLDPNVPLKPSGVEWLGDVPDHWEVVLNQRIFKENIRPHNDQPEIALSLSQRGGLLATTDMKERSLKTSTYDNWKLTLPGDIVVNRFKAHLGVFFASTLRGIVSFHYGVFEPRREMVPKYFEYLYHTEPYRAIYAGRSNGMTVGLQNLSNQNFYNVKSIVPPLGEQRVIVEYADQSTVDIEVAKESARREIELLREYRTRLIADVVTGKLDVREAAARLPDETDETDALDESDMDAVAELDADQDAEEDLEAVTA